jgi:hypothetical protein
MPETVVLHEFVTAHRDVIIQRCREAIATRSLPPATIGGG